VSVAPPPDRREFYEGIGYTALCTGDALTFLDRAEDGRRTLAAAVKYFERSGSRFGIYAARALVACSFLMEGRYERGAQTLSRIWPDLQTLQLEDILWRSKARFAYYFDLRTRRRLQQIEDLGLWYAGQDPITGDQNRFRQQFADQAAQSLSSISLLLGDAAAATVQKAIDKLRGAENAQALAEAATGLAQGIQKVAYENYRQAIDHVESVRARLETDLNKRAFRADKQLLYEGYVRLSVALYGPEVGLEAVERAKARELLDLLAGRRIDFKHRQLAAAERNSRQKASAALAEAIKENRGPSAVKPALERYRAVMVKIRRQDPELASLMEADAPGFERIEKVVPRPGALLTYYVATDSVYIFVVRAGRAYVQETPISAKVLARQVSDFREAILHRRESAEIRIAKRLYALLFGPVERLLHEKRLVVIPDGPLHYLPFSALSDGEFRLSERFSLSFSPSAGVLAFARAKTAPKKRSVLAFGNPDLKNRALDLPSAQMEAIQVAELYPGSKAIVGPRATETAARELTPSYSVLHFATHGEFSNEDPLYSGLRLAADDRNDGRLEAAEIFSLDLSAGIVALSACRTVLGLVTRGGEIIGLNRAFLYAGAPRILSSLWSVSDESTRLLMLDFYRNLQLMPADRALQEAQLRLMQSERFRAPYFWAPFYLTGDWR
jgi:CHAT domain-containing protein